MLQLFLANKNLIYSVLSKILMLRKEITIVLQIIQTPKKLHIESNFSVSIISVLVFISVKKLPIESNLLVYFSKETETVVRRCTSK